MVRLVIDEAISRVLGQQTEPVELFDADGRAVGRFVPHSESAPTDGCEAKCPPSDEDIRIAQKRLAGDGIWHRASDAIEHLDAMDVL